MPRTRSTVNRRTSTTKKAETNPPPEVPKPSREQKAKVVKKPRAKKGKETSNDSTASPISVGSKIPWTNSFGGAIYLHDGTKTSLKQLVEKSHNGLIVYAYPKSRDDESDDLHGEMDHSQLDLESLEMDTIGIYRDTVSSIAEFMEEPGSGVPIASNLSGSLMKAMSLTSPKGVLKQGAFIISKEGILLGRTVGGKVDKIMDDVWKMIHIIKEERGEEEDW
ncbi:hypothetical protein A0O28_0042870 [Trichoderma guizhouense]|uniref:Alkyl hydroperoxide reductase subunit C/ Thiol specific antioxidant domain-containing protein n=1 Tax=Trichoderma guizhouense TaxID=1491466 RepID=A0A1T3C8Q3_9HYPO|nr:hypothetical protein A0O28_0042870 [Trichoderma guizhouense]